MTDYCAFLESTAIRFSSLRAFFPVIFLQIRVGQVLMPCGCIFLLY